MHRLISIPLSRPAFQKELATIKHLARVNEVRVDIDTMVRRKIIRKCLDSTTVIPRISSCGKRERWIRLPFLGPFSNKLGRVLRPFGFRPAYYNPVTVKRLFVKLKDRIPREERSGVYSVRCANCDGVYIGETGRQLKIRIDEHKKAWSNNKVGESAFADHLINYGHSIKEGSEVLLHMEKSYYRRLALEHIEINRHLNNDDVSVVNRHIPDGNLIDSVYEPYLDG